jgi:phosphoserine phosphatase
MSGGHSERQAGARGLALIDVDGTLTRHRSIWQYLMEQTGTWSVGLRNLKDYQEGRIGYREFCDRDAAVFRGSRYSDVQAIAHGVPKPPGLGDLFAGLERVGCDVVLLSTGLRVLADYFTDRFPIVECRVNDLESADGLCTGRSVIAVEEGTKAEHARELVETYRPGYVVAIGDSAGDLGMFESADVSIAVDPVGPHVSAAADRTIASEEIGGVGALLETLLPKVRERESYDDRH